MSSLSETSENTAQAGSHFNPQVDSLVQRLIHGVDKDRLAILRKDFHSRLRLTLTHPESSSLIEDLWDFFYDWCIFEQKLPDHLKDLTDADRAFWEEIKSHNQRGLYNITRCTDEILQLKELFVGKTLTLKKHNTSDFVGISKGDIIEARLVQEPIDTPKTEIIYLLARRPSYHPSTVHAYLKQKVRTFKKVKDFSSYQNWLWLIVGMYLKHRIYHHMPIEKIYDDNSRI